MLNTAKNNTSTNQVSQNIEDHIPTLANTAFSQAFVSAARNGQTVTYVQGHRIVKQKSDGTLKTIEDFSMQQEKFYQPVTKRIFSRRQK